MDFSAEQANQIMQATKTTHRYPARGKRCGQRRGQLLDVNKTTVLEDGSKERERKSHRVRVLSVARGRVEAVSEVEARSEGFRSVERFLEAYEAAFGVREGDCWVLAFEVEEQPRILKPAGAPGFTEKGYGAGADVLDAGNAVDEFTQERLCLEADRRREEFLASVPLHERLRLALEDAEARGIDHRWQAKSIEQRVASLEAKLRKKAA